MLSVVVAVAAFTYFALASERPASAPEKPAAIEKPSSDKREELASRAPVDSPVVAPNREPAQPANVAPSVTIEANQPAVDPNLPEDLRKSAATGPVELPPDLQAQLNAPPPELPEDLKRQFENQPTELPDDLKAQLNAPPPPIPDDIRRALNTPPRIVSIDEVNTPQDGR